MVFADLRSSMNKRQRASRACEVSSALVIYIFLETGSRGGFEGTSPRLERDCDRLAYRASAHPRAGYLEHRKADQSPFPDMPCPQSTDTLSLLQPQIHPNYVLRARSCILTSILTGPLRCGKPRRSVYQLRRLPDRVSHPNTETEEGAEHHRPIQGFGQV